MHPQALQMFDQAREKAGIPFMVTRGGGFRCQKYIESGSSVANTSHGSNGVGWAGDFEARLSRDRFRIVKAALATGFTRIGVAHNFIHLDCDPSKPPSVIWTYS